MTARRYLNLELPERFALEIRDEQGHWHEWGVYLARDFERQDDGSYVCGGYPYGSPTYFRCIAHRDGYFEHIDGGGHGQVWAYRIVPIPL